MKYLLVYASCGHGHKKAAEYVAEELKRRGETDVTLIDFLDYATPFCKWAYPFVYKYSVMYIPWLWAIGFDLTNIKGINWLIRIVRRVYNHISAPRLEKFFIEHNPEVIFLPHFFPSEASGALKQKGKITSTIVTMVTDAVAHATWINRGSDHFIGFSEQTKQELVKWGIPEKKIHVLGIPISSKFTLQGRRAEYRKKHGIDEGLFTVLLASGSFGMGPMERLVRLLERYAGKVQVMVVCANNKILFEKLKKETFTIPVKPFPFIDFMDELMEASDLLISKPGGLTMCESLAKELPLVISRPIPGQEMYNVDLLMSHDAAFRIQKVDEIIPIMDSIFADSQLLDKKRENIRTLKKPQATQEIVDFLQTLEK